MTTSPRTHLKTWTRRVLGTTLALILTAATLAGVILAGVIVSSRSIHQPVPTDSADVPASSLTHTEPGGSKNPTVTRNGQRLVVAFVAGTEGTIASDLLAPYDIFSSSPAFTTYVVADAASPVPLEGGPAARPDAHVRRHRRRPRPEARLGRRARSHQAHRHSRSAAAQLGGPPARGRGEDPRRVQRRNGARRHRDARRTGRHQPLVTHQRPGEEPPRRELDARPSLRRGRVRDHHGSRHLRRPGRTAPGRRARRTR